MSYRPSGIDVPHVSQPQIPAPKIKGINIGPRSRPDQDVSDGGGDGFVVGLLLAAVALAAWLMYA